MPRSPGHVFYDRLQGGANHAGFDAFAEKVCKLLRIRTPRKAFHRLLTSAVVVAALACCYTPDPENMVAVGDAKGTPVDHTLTNGVTVWAVTRGNTAAVYTTYQFRIALIESLRAANMLAAYPWSAKYRLSASIESASTPLIGMTVPVALTVKYTLTDNARTWQIPIESGGKATIWDAYLGTNRVIMAHENAVRNNISSLLDVLMTFKESTPTQLENPSAPPPSNKREPSNPPPAIELSPACKRFPNLC